MVHSLWVLILSLQIAPATPSSEPLLENVVLQEAAFAPPTALMQKRLAMQLMPKPGKEEGFHQVAALLFQQPRAMHLPVPEPQYPTFPARGLPSMLP